MHDIQILREWSVAALTGLREPYLDSLTYDESGHCIWSIERSTHQLLQFHWASETVKLYALPKDLDIYETCMDGQGLLYGCGREPWHLYLLNDHGRHPELMSTDTISKHGRLSGCSEGGVIVRTSIENDIYIVRYASDKQKVWDWSTGVSFKRQNGPINLIPVFSGTSTYVIIEDGSLRVVRLDASGEYRGEEQLFTVDKPVSRRILADGRSEEGWVTYLYDTTTSPFPDSVLITGRYQQENCLILYRRDMPPVAYQIPAAPERIRSNVPRRIAGINAHMVIGYRNFQTTKECSLVLFGIPDWQDAEPVSLNVSED